MSSTWVKSQRKFIALPGQLSTTINNGKHDKRPHTLLGTLKKLDGMIDGWGKHYWFCNDDQIWRNVDAKINAKISHFLGFYRDVRNGAIEERKMGLLGVSELIRIDREPFSYPKIS